MTYPVPNDADILIHAGDFTKYSDDREIKDFNRYMGTLTSIKHKIVIAGNHEGTLDRKFSDDTEINRVRSLFTNFTYLQDSFIELYGLKIYGSPW